VFAHVPTKDVGGPFLRQNGVYFKQENAFHTIICMNLVCLKNTIIMQCLSPGLHVCALQRQHSVRLLSRLLHCNLYPLYIH